MYVDPTCDPANPFRRFGRESTHFSIPTKLGVFGTAPYFHDGAAKTLDEAVKQMAWLQLGRSLSDADTASIVTFLNALENTRPVTLSSVK